MGFFEKPMSYSLKTHDLCGDTSWAYCSMVMNIANYLYIYNTDYFYNTDYTD